MATERYHECKYGGTDMNCPVCRQPVEIEDRSAILGDSPETLEVTVKVQEPLYGEEFEFVASLEDEGIMFATGYDWHNVDGRPVERDEDAWAGLDALLGINVRESAIESGIGASVPGIGCYPAVSYAVLPYDLALLVRRAVRK